MWKVDIYLETDSKVQKDTERKCGYVLETVCAGATRTVEGFGCISGTYHGANLQSLEDALSRVTKTCEICIHTEDAYVAARIMKLWKMEGAGWKDSRGNPIRNADLWKKIWERVEKYHLKIATTSDKHSYSGWLREQMDSGRCKKMCRTKERGNYKCLTDLER